MRARQAKRRRAGSRTTVIVDPSAPVTVAARKALAAFRTGVRKELATLARKGIPTAATVNGHRVVGVPKKMGNTYILVPVRSASNGRRTVSKRSDNRARSR